MTSLEKTSVNVPSGWQEDRPRVSRGSWALAFSPGKVQTESSSPAPPPRGTFSPSASTHAPRRRRRLCMTMVRVSIRRSGTVNRLPRSYSCPCANRRPSALVVRRPLLLRSGAHQRIARIVISNSPAQRELRFGAEGAEGTCRCD